MSDETPWLYPVGLPPHPPEIVSDELRPRHEALLRVLLDTPELPAQVTLIDVARGLFVQRPDPLLVAHALVTFWSDLSDYDAFRLYDRFREAFNSPPTEKLKAEALNYFAALLHLMREESTFTRMNERLNVPSVRAAYDAAAAPYKHTSPLPFGGKKNTGGKT